MNFGGVLLVVFSSFFRYFPFVNFSTFPLGPFIISTGGLIVFFGILIAALVLIRTVRDEEVSLKFLSDHLFFFVFLPLFFGRLGAFLAMWPAFQRRLSDDLFQNLGEIFRGFFLIGDGGLKADWAVGGFFLVFLLLAAWKKQKHFAWLDAFILPGILISVFVSIGGYISGWNYGSPAPDWLPFPFTVEYDLQDVRYSGSLYAIQLYSATLAFLLFFVGRRMWHHKIWRKWVAGKFFATMLFFFGIFNGFLEFFRGDAAQMVFDIRLSQILSFAVSAGALLFLFFLRKFEKPLLHRLHVQKDQK